MSNWKLLVREDDSIVWWSGMQSYMDKYNLHWKNNYEFEDTLEYHGFSRGNSSCIILFKSLSNKQIYHVFMIDFEDIIFNLKDGKISGKFTFTKRGQNYGIKIVK